MKELLGEWNLSTDFYSVLKKNIPSNQWDWYLYELVGTVNSLPSGVNSIIEFEENIRASDYGLKFSWNDILSLALRYTDVQCCILNASSIPIRYKDIKKNKGLYSYIYFEIFDSTSWKLVDFR
ncbi:hypothetical protein [Ignatzschineria sp. LJL83]